MFLVIAEVGRLLESVIFSHRNRTVLIRVDYMSKLSDIITGLIFPVLCLFLIILRRAFINLPYQQWVRKYSMYMLIRVIVILILFCFHKTIIVGMFVQLLLGIFDICVYNSSSHAFSVLLKGRRDEAFYHPSRSDYLEKKRIANQFFYTQLFTHFLGFQLLLLYVSSFAYYIFDTIHDPNLFELMTFGYFPNFPSSWYPIASKIKKNMCQIRAALVYMTDLYMFFVYLFVSLSILVKLFIRKKKFNHVNDWLTRPLMENYRATLEERTQQRPPFIQAFRSHLVYR